jgi:choline dehydrogenase
VYRKGDAEHAVEASHEVILCGGAINSPQLLMLSGIGSKKQLERVGIQVLVDLPGVGQNLQDHLMVPVAYHCTEPVSLALAGSDAEVKKFQEAQRGMLTSNIPEAGGFLKLDPDSPAPELQFHFCPGWFVMHGAGNPGGHGFTLLPSLVGTKSVGSLRLRSADPSAPPRIDPNFLAEEADMAVLVEGVKRARKILRSPIFDTYRGDEYLPGAAVQTNAEIAAFIRDNVQNLYHPVGTCKMGNDPLAVVSHQLRVHGVQRLRVADASIMPVIINANTNAPCIMIGEKCADMLLKAS